MKHLNRVLGVAVLLAWATLAPAATIQVGPTRTYTTVAAGYGAASAGDTIEIDSGTYYQSAGWVSIAKSNLTFRGVGATRPLLDAGNSALSTKGIFVVSSGGANLTVDNIEFANAYIPNTSGANAAGIRFQASTLTVRNCYFHNSQDGILTDAGSTSDILIETSEFSHNGESNPSNTNGYGYTHNMYIGNIRSFTLRYCYSHDSNEGHVVKTRANTNYILYNLLTTETSNGSFELQLCQGGTGYVIGNVILQGDGSDNATIVSYGGDGGTNANPYLYVVNNTLINQRSSGAIFLAVNTPVTQGVFQNNIVQWYGYETLIGGSYAGAMTQTTNWVTTNAHLANIANHDYHLTAASTGAINAGTAPGTGYNSYSLVPVNQYIHPYSYVTRPTDASVDVGAYEYVAPNQPPVASSPSATGALVFGQASAVTVSCIATDSDGTVQSVTANLSTIGGSGSQALVHGSGNTWSWSGTVTPPTGGTKTITFTATDNNGATATASTTITVDTPPTVNAGADQKVIEGQAVSLQATASDPDSDPLTYTWTQPAGLNVSLAGGTTASAGFTAPTVSTVAQAAMTFTVTVSDGKGGLASDSVNVRVYMLGDTNQDDSVDVIDLLNLVAAFGSVTGDPNYDPTCDLNNDGGVDVIDLLDLVGSFGRTIGS